MNEKVRDIANYQVGKEMIFIQGIFQVFHMVSVAPLTFFFFSKQEVRLVHMQLNSSMLNQISVLHFL